jgi:hypothetical protein
MGTDSHVPKARAFRAARTWRSVPIAPCRTPRAIFHLPPKPRAPRAARLGSLLRKSGRRNGAPPGRADLRAMPTKGAASGAPTMPLAFSPLVVTRGVMGDSLENASCRAGACPGRADLCTRPTPGAASGTPTHCHPPQCDGSRSHRSCCPPRPVQVSSSALVQPSTQLPASRAITLIG